MSAPIVDLEQGRLRLTASQFRALLREVESPSFTAPVDATEVEALNCGRQALLEAGVFGASGSPAEVFAPAFAALVGPLLAAKVGLYGTTGQELHQLWVGPDQGLAAAHVSGDWYEIIRFSPPSTAVTMARLSRLAPKASDPPTGRAVLDGDALAASANPAGAGNSMVLSLATACWPTISADIAAGSWRLIQWRIQWAPPLYSGRQLSGGASIIETPSNYLCLSVSHGSETLRAATPTDLWEKLIKITRPPAGIDPTALQTRTFARGKSEQTDSGDQQWSQQKRWE